MRKALSLTQSELGNQTGTTQQIISRIETGQQAPDLEQALAIARALGCSPEVLFSRPTPSTEKAAA